MTTATPMLPSRLPVARRSPRPVSPAALRGAGPRPRPVQVASSRSPVARARLQLTRRGRLVLVLVVAAVLAGAFSVGRSSTATTASGPAWRPAAVVVGPHETLWQLASRVAPGGDPRATVDRIVRLNALSSAVVRPGQRLLVPRR